MSMRHLFMSHYFSNTEDKRLEAIKQAAKETLKNNVHHYDTKKTNAKGYSSNGESSVQEAVYHILPELKLRIIFPSAYFVNFKQRVQVLLSEKELQKLSDDSPYFLRDQI